MKKKFSQKYLNSYVNIDVKLKTKQWLYVCAILDLYRKNNPDKFLFPIENFTHSVKKSLKIFAGYENFLLPEGE